MLQRLHGLLPKLLLIRVRLTRLRCRKLFSKNTLPITCNPNRLLTIAEPVSRYLPL